MRGRVPDPQSGPDTQGREPITGAKQAAAARDGETAADAPLVIWDEKTERARELDKTLEGWTAAFEEMRDIVPPRPRPEDVYLRRSEFLKALEGSAHVNLKELSLAGDQSPATADGSLTAQEFTFPTQRAPKFHGAVKAFIEDLKTRMADRELVAFVIPTAGKVDRLRDSHTALRSFQTWRLPP